MRSRRFQNRLGFWLSPFITCQMAIVDSLPLTSLPSQIYSAQIYSVGNVLYRHQFAGDDEGTFTRAAVTLNPGQPLFTTRPDATGFHDDLAGDGASPGKGTMSGFRQSGV